MTGRDQAGAQIRAVSRKAGGQKILQPIFGLAEVAILPQFCATLDDVFNERFSLERRIPFAEAREFDARMLYRAGCKFHIEQGHPLCRDIDAPQPDSRALRSGGAELAVGTNVGLQHGHVRKSIERECQLVLRRVNLPHGVQK